LSTWNRAFSEFARMLRSDGIGLVYQVFTGPRMSDTEAKAFWQNELGYAGAHSVRPADIESVLSFRVGPFDLLDLIGRDTRLKRLASTRGG
jgi:hypothetical protein